MKVHSLVELTRHQVVRHASTGVTSIKKAPRMLMASWFVIGMLPFLLQIRSYLKFVTPHKISEDFLVPPDAQKETTNLTELCPVEGFDVADVWWNIANTHYISGRSGLICHFVVPQYNVHGNYVVFWSSKGLKSTSSGCKQDSFPMEQYYYHGSIGYYSFYEELKGMFCPDDKTAYLVVQTLGTFDINGSFLAEDTGGDNYRHSWWYAVVAGGWLTYRALVLRRSYTLSRQYGRRCSQVGETLSRKEAVIFIQESLRLSAHGANNYHRVALIFLLLESAMSDLFLLAAINGFAAKLQYVSMGYNLSGLMLLIFESIENTKCLQEKWRLGIKRLLFSYETAFLGEVLSSALQQYFLTGLNRSGLKHSRTTALAVSYYIWSLFGHGAIVLGLLGFIIFVRVVWAVGYVWWVHGTWSIFTESCCVDSMLKLSNKMTTLGGYRWENGKMYYRKSAFKAFGLLKMEEEDGTELLVLRKMYWFAAPANDFVAIGVLSGQCVKQCSERSCTGVISFLGRSIGGPSDEVEGGVRRNVEDGPASVNILPSS